MQNGRLKGTRRTTSRLPSRSVAMISWAPQSENQRRPSCQRGDSPIAKPVSNVFISGIEECVVDTYQHHPISSLVSKQPATVSLLPGDRPGQRYHFAGSRRFQLQPRCLSSAKEQLTATDEKPVDPDLQLA